MNSTPSSPQRTAARRSRWRWALGPLVLGLPAAFGGCLYDASDRCSANEVLQNQRCVCVAGSLMTAHGCTPCGAHEVPGDGECVCDTGYTRPAPTSACVPAALGATCDTASQPCSDTTFDFCETVAGTRGYCTNSGCTTSADCIGGYACDTTSSPSVCLRPPTGLGMPCKSSADCAGFEATYCETVQSHQCMVAGCTTTPDDCFSGYQCCDFRSLGANLTLCVPTGGCPT